MLGVIKLLLTFEAGRVSGVVLSLTFMVLCSSLILLMFEKEMSLHFVASWWGEFGMVCFLVGFEARLFHVGFVERKMVMVIYFGKVPFLLSLRFPEFHDLIRMDKGHWPRCFLW